MALSLFQAKYLATLANLADRGEFSFPADADVEAACDEDGLHDGQSDDKRRLRGPSRAPGHHHPRQRGHRRPAPYRYGGSRRAFYGR